MPAASHVLVELASKLLYDVFNDFERTLPSIATARLDRPALEAACARLHPVRGATLSKSGRQGGQVEPPGKQSSHKRGRWEVGGRHTAEEAMSTAVRMHETASSINRAVSMLLVGHC